VVGAVLIKIFFSKQNNLSYLLSRIHLIIIGLKDPIPPY